MPKIKQISIFYSIDNKIAVYRLFYKILKQ